MTPIFLWGWVQHFFKVLNLASIKKNILKIKPKINRKRGQRHAIRIKSNDLFHSMHEKVIATVN